MHNSNYYTPNLHFCAVKQHKISRNYDGCNVMAAEGQITMSKWTSAVSRSKATKSKLTFRDTLQIDIGIFVCRCDVSFQRYAVSSAEVMKTVVTNLMLLAPNFGGPIFLRGGGAFVNQHHFRHTGQVWLRSYGWSLIYADEIF